MEDNQNLQETPAGTNQATAGSAAAILMANMERLAGEWDVAAGVQRDIARKAFERYHDVDGRELHLRAAEAYDHCSQELKALVAMSIAAERTSSSALVPPAPTNLLAGAAGRVERTIGLQWEDGGEIRTFPVTITHPAEGGTNK